LDKLQTYGAKVGITKKEKAELRTLRKADKSLVIPKNSIEYIEFLNCQLKTCGDSSFTLAPIKQFARSAYKLKVYFERLKREGAQRKKWAHSYLRDIIRGS